MPDNAAQPRLSLATLARLPSTVARPAYDPASVSVGILHLGLGAFHRAHQAVYTDDILGAEPRWGICGVSLKTPRAVSPLAAQDGLYTLLTRTSDGTSARVIGALRETFFAGAARSQLIARFADHRISVATATVTEKGYCHAPRRERSTKIIPRSRMTSRIPTHRSRRSAFLSQESRRDVPRTQDRSRSSAATTSRTMGAWSRGWCGPSPRAAILRSLNGSPITLHFHRRWWTGSSPPLPTSTSPTRNV